MKPKILIIGSTGKLGVKLLNFCKKSNINIFCITGFKNSKLLISQSKKNKIKNYFKLSDHLEVIKFKKFLHYNKINIVYFLDYGFNSLIYLDIFLKVNKKSLIAIANKEMIIAGGDFLINRISNTNNKLIPLDSEHFSLIKNKFDNKNIEKIYITASGGPFYFKKKVDLNKVKLKSVLAHPKWKMGTNNSIDSSNFINKILEIFELSIIFKIDLKKIEFLINQDAYIHSIIIGKDNIININCFDNDMLITLVNPLLKFYPQINLKYKKSFLNHNSLKIKKFNDKRFKIHKYLDLLKGLSPQQQLSFMILNNIAQRKYLSGAINYNDIIDFIMTELKNTNIIKKFINLNDRLEFIQLIKSKYEI